MCDMFLFLNGASLLVMQMKTPPFMAKDNKMDVISALEEAGEIILIRFSDNQTKLNTDKCHLLLNMQKKNILDISNFNIP